MGIRVLVIDDSPFARAAMAEMLSSVPGIEVSGTAVDGVDGLVQAVRTRPDVITLDLEMPNLDGYSFLRLAARDLRVPVVVVSGADPAECAPLAFELGAADYLTRPGARAVREIFSIKEELKRALFSASAASDAPDPAPRNYEGVVCVGASSGGPTAVRRLVRALPADFPAPVFVAMHMPTWLGRPFAERLASETPLEVCLAEEGLPVRGGTVVVAPGGRHLSFRRSGNEVRVSLLMKNPQDLYAPSVDKLFSSASAVWGEALVGVVLTGMGTDGTRGGAEVIQRGGELIVQSPESSVAPGMPGAALEAGLTGTVLEPEAIARRIAWSMSSGCLKKTGWSDKIITNFNRLNAVSPHHDGESVPFKGMVS